MSCQADYVAWRSGVGSVYMPSDYEIWHQQFGQSVDFAANAKANKLVPEPTVLGIFLMVVAAIFVNWKSVAQRRKASRISR